MTDWVYLTQQLDEVRSLLQLTENIFSMDSINMLIETYGTTSDQWNKIILFKSAKLERKSIHP